MYTIVGYSLAIVHCIGTDISRTTRCKSHNDISGPQATIDHTLSAVQGDLTSSIPTWKVSRRLKTGGLETR